MAHITHNRERSSRNGKFFCFEHHGLQSLPHVFTVRFFGTVIFITLN
jgi:hypothetical protein